MLTDDELCETAEQSQLPVFADMARELLAARAVVEAAKRSRPTILALKSALSKYDEVTK